MQKINAFFDKKNEKYLLLVRALIEGLGLPYKGEASIESVRTSYFFEQLLAKDYSLQSLFEILLQPTIETLSVSPKNRSEILNFFVKPLLTKKRGKRKILEVASLLNLKTQVSYHYWENGKRDMPFWIFLKWVDLVCEKLEVFVESLQMPINLKSLGFQEKCSEKFSSLFFSLPWIPTVYLALQTTEYLSSDKHSDDYICKTVQISPEQLQSALDILSSLEMIHFEINHYVVRRGIFYAPPSPSNEKINSLNAYWMAKAPQLMQYDGIHKVQQAALSIESKNKIMTWVSELREKIHEEIKKTSGPETVLHMHWQVADLLQTRERE